MKRYDFCVIRQGGSSGLFGPVHRKDDLDDRFGFESRATSMSRIVTDSVDEHTEGSGTKNVLLGSRVRRLLGEMLRRRE